MKYSEFEQLPEPKLQLSQINQSLIKQHTTQFKHPYGQSTIESIRTPNSFSHTSGLKGVQAPQKEKKKKGEHPYGCGAPAGEVLLTRGVWPVSTFQPVLNL